MVGDKFFSLFWIALHWCNKINPLLEVLDPEHQLSSSILYFCSIDQMSLIKDISINARKQSSVVFYSRPKAVCSQGETFQILTDCSVSSSFICKFLLRTMRKELKNEALSVRAGFLGSSQPFWEAEFPIYCLKERK